LVDTVAVMSSPGSQQSHIKLHSVNDSPRGDDIGEDENEYSLTLGSRPLVLHCILVPSLKQIMNQ